MFLWIRCFGQHFFAGVVCVLLLASCGASQVARTPDTFLVPRGYIGWIRVDYGVHGAAPLTRVNGRLVHRIPASGYLKTSTVSQEGMAQDEFYFVEGQHRERLDNSEDATGMVWNQMTGFSLDENTSPDLTQLTMFIGSQSQFDLADRLPYWSWVGKVSGAGLEDGARLGLSRLIWAQFLR